MSPRDRSVPADLGVDAPGVPAQLGLASIREVELSEALPSLVGGPSANVLLLVRLCAQPVGMVFRAVSEVAEPEALARAIEADLGDQITEASAAHGIRFAGLTAAGLPHDSCPRRAAADEAVRRGPGISVVISTLNGEKTLAATLESVLASNYHAFEVIVVDNGSATDDCAQLTRRLSETHEHGSRLRFLAEPGGLSRARNAGIRQARHDLLFFVDDDERIDRWSLGAIGAEFADPAVGFVTGVILPAELETPAQVTFEQLGGHSKGRGFRRVRFDADYLAEVQSPLFPVPPFGAGGNMAFRREVLTQIGMFDTALGAGTPAAGAEDTLAFSQALIAGWHGIYTPDVVVWHLHYRLDADRTRQLRGYATGVGAYYAALILHEPHVLVALARLLPRAIRYVRSPGGRQLDAGSRESPPARHSQWERPSMDVRGLLRGPGLYVKGRRRAQR